MTLEYLTWNGLSKYPFRDNSPCKNNAYTIPNDLILDVVIFCKTSDIKIVKLGNFEKTNDDAIFTFDCYEADGITLITSEDITVSLATIAQDVADKKVFGLVGLYIDIKLIPGPALVIEIVRDEAFTDVELEDSAIILYRPKVDSIAFYNQNVLLHTVVADAVDIAEGANISFKFVKDTAQFSVIRGAGTGLYNACNEELFIKEINSIPPDTNNNFTLNTDGCYIMDAADNGLVIDNICTPKCTADQFANYTHYLNRIQDGMSTVGAYAGQLYNDLKARIDEWATLEYPLLNKPYYKIAYSKFKVSNLINSYYYSFVIGLYNPKKTPINVILHVTQNIAPDSNYAMGFKTETFRFKTAEGAVLLPTPDVDVGVVPCTSVARFEFVTHGRPNDTVTITGAIDSAMIDETITLDDVDIIDD